MTCICVQCSSVIPEHRVFTKIDEKKGTRTMTVSCEICASMHERVDQIGPGNVFGFISMNRVTDLKRINGILEAIRKAEGAIQLQGA